MKSRTFLLFLLMSAGLAAAQARPEFEAASVRIVPPGENLESHMPTLDVTPGGVIHIYNRRLDEIILLAYNIGGGQLSGPRWLTELTVDASAVTRFEIQAKVPEGARKEDIPVMLQNLLADRFKLQVHREPRATQIYSLEVDKAGPRFEASVANADRAPGCARQIGGGAEGGVLADCYNVSLAQFAQQLQTLAPAYFREGPIVDRTGLTGAYDLRLEWMMQQQLDAGMSGPTMFEAIEKLGLKLEKKREEAEILVVDRCEQVPSEN